MAQYSVIQIVGVFNSIHDATDFDIVFDSVFFGFKKKDPKAAQNS